LTSKNCNTTVVGEDTNLLILLLYYAKNYKFKLYFRSGVTRSSSKNPLNDIIHIQISLGNDISKCLLFIHAFNRYDTSSSVFSIETSKA